MSDAINHLINGDLELFKQAIHQSLYSRVGTAFQEKKKELSTELFNEEECASCGEQIEESDEGGIPKTPRQKKLAAKSGNPNRITRGDVIAAIQEKGKK